MWNSTVGLINGKYRYLTAETFGFKVNSNGQMLKKRQQWTIEPFSEPPSSNNQDIISPMQQQQQHQQQQLPNRPSQVQQPDPYDPYIMTLNSAGQCSSMTSIKSSSNGSTSSDPDNCNEEHENVAIKSHLNKYLAVDSFGNVTCDSEEKTENARFTITICSMSQGRSKDEQIFWAFKNVERGYFLGTCEDGNLSCNAKMPKSRAELWLLHLIPARGSSFFSLKSLGRKRYARLVEDGNNQAQVQLDATNSWGGETLFQIKFHEGGLYSILTSDCRYLTNEGRCIRWTGDQTSPGSTSSTIDTSSNGQIVLDPGCSTLPPKECLFTIEYHSGFLAFRDSFSQYLAAAGRTSLLRSRSAGVSRDELFVFENSPIQVSLKATFNNRWVSIKQGVDLSANQLEANPTTETFQMIYHPESKNWSIMTHECNYWTVSQQTGTISICSIDNYPALDKGLFRIVWSDSEATCSLKLFDPKTQLERWIGARKSGQLYLAPSGSQDPVKFIMRFQNRKLLNLRPVNGTGFVGLKSGSLSRQLEATKTCPESIVIEYSELLSSNVLSNEQILNLDNGISKGSSNEPQGNKFGRPLEQVKLIKSQPVTQYNAFEARNEVQNSNDYDLNEDWNRAKVLPEDMIDDNNNNSCFVEDKMIESEQSVTSSEEQTNGSVESAPIASVASIISSFSAAKISNGVAKQQPTFGQTKITSSRVSKLASSFDGNAAVIQETQQLRNQSDHSDTGSVVSKTNGQSYDDQQQHNTNTKPLSTSERLAQFECCYLKVLHNNRYLVVGDKDSSIVCDAVNRACAQPWIIELRSHNSIAIRASDDHAYMQLGTNGTITLSRCEPQEASLWEF